MLPDLVATPDLPSLPGLPSETWPKPNERPSPANAAQGAKQGTESPQDRSTSKATAAASAKRANDATASPPPSVQAAADEMGEVVRRLAADFPNDSDALDLMARVELMLGHSAKAADCWKKSIELNPNDTRAYRGLASVAQKTNPQEQLRLLRKALSLDLRSFDTHFELAKALVDHNQSKEAITLLQAHLQLFPNSPRSYSLLGGAYLQENDLRKAKQAYETAVKLEPRDDFPYLGLAKVCARLGDQEAAKRYQEKFQELRSGTWQKLRSQRGRYEDLMAQCDTLSNICTRAGALYDNHQHRGQAERLWRRAAVATPTHADSRKALADLYLKTGRTADAIPVIEQLVEILPADAKYCLKLGQLCVESGQTDKAEAALIKACQRDPKAAAGHTALAELYVKTNRKPADAVASARKATELEPTADRYWLLATACRRNGDAAAARTALDKAIELDPGNLQYREAQQTLKEKK